MNIILIGFRGTGKTTIGKILARQLGKEFIDADVYLEKQEGIPIKAVFTKGGYEEVQFLLEQRRPIYDRIADFVINTAHVSVASAAHKIQTLIHHYVRG